MESAKEIRGYGDVVLRGGRVDGDDRHGISMVTHS
jgi:hypothetical protein